MLENNYILYKYKIYFCTFEKKRFCYQSDEKYKKKKKKMWANSLIRDYVKLPLTFFFIIIYLIFLALKEHTSVVCSFRAHQLLSAVNMIKIKLM